MKIKTRRYYIYYTVKVLFFLMRLVPRRISLTVADFLGSGVFRVLQKYRDQTISNLNEIFIDKPQQNAHIAENVFRNMAKNGVDWMKLTSLSKKGVGSLVTEVHGLEHLDKARADGKGVILMASHFGNWELLSIYLCSKGYQGTIVARRIYFHKYDKFVSKLRNRFGALVAYRNESPKKLLKVLKNGGILGILADQDVDSVEGVFVDFFGKPAYTPTAPVRLGMTTGASIVPAFMIRKPDNMYKLIVESPISLAQADKKDEESVKKYTQAWTKVLERYVRQYPDQWVWMHSRWKTRPAVGIGEGLNPSP